VLDVGNNALASLAGAVGLPSLATLSAAGNALSRPAALAGLAGCARLATLDLTENQLEVEGEAEAEELLRLLSSLPALRVLYLAKGNPGCAAALGARDGGYRRAVLAALPRLVYLDERPVFDAERRAVEAWTVGGAAGERAAAAAEAVRARRRSTLPSPPLSPARAGGARGCDCG